MKQLHMRPHKHTNFSNSIQALQLTVERVAFLQVLHDITNWEYNVELRFSVPLLPPHQWSQHNQLVIYIAKYRISNIL